MYGIFRGKKTYLAALLTIAGAGVAYLTGEATALQATQLVVSAVFAATLRNGMR